MTLNLLVKQLLVCSCTALHARRPIKRQPFAVCNLMVTSHADF